ncbi:MAG: cadmium-translocating P-type ATPase [Idiomarina sp.]|nr:cadmium-translocating P-type ATPase [Idiomarina sp.]
MSDSLLCFHCHQPVPRGLDLKVEILDRMEPMCCYGCQAVAQTIVDQGLVNFYKFRQLDETSALPLIPDELSTSDLQLNAYDEPDIQKEFVQSEQGQLETTLAVEGMTCAACAWLIERQVRTLEGVSKVVVHASTDRVHVRWDPEQQKLSEILRAIHQVGYKALPFQHADLEESYTKQRRSYIMRLGVAGVASMQTMMVAFGLYYDDIDDAHRLYFWWLSLLFTAPVIVYSCQPFFANAWRALRARTLNMDVPVSLAMIFAFVASFYATLTDTGEIYYECVTMFAFFLLSGRYLELLARQRAITHAANLMKLIPAIAERKVEEDWERIIVRELAVGDIIRVQPGDTIPVDGELVNATGWCNEAQLTGESRPIAKYAGDLVYAGSINQDSPMEIAVTATHQNTLLAKIIHMQDHALGQKPRIVRMADHLSKYFVLGTLIVASFTYAAWMFVDPDRAFWVVLAVLVATCPCALSLAAPTAMSGAVSRLNQHGILLKQSDVVEKLPLIRTVCVDKTGTLTEGHFRIGDSWYEATEDRDFINSVAASIESYSEHPISRPFKRLAPSQNVSAVENTTGAGLTAQINDTNYRIGSLSFIQAWHPNFSSPLRDANVYLATKERVLAAWCVNDALRKDTHETIQWLQGRDFEVVMLTGDLESRAHELAQTVGINRVHAELSPQDKLAVLAQIQSQGAVLMIGDGINDGPVLAQADASVTFASGADLAQSGSDVVILNGELAGVRQLFATSSSARRIIRQNFTWALGYNALILPLAVTGYVGPLLAMLGMSMSSLIVMTNSLRLARKKG